MVYTLTATLYEYGYSDPSYLRLNIFSRTRKQGRRNRGGPIEGGQARLHFLPKGHFWKLESMLFPENFFHFREKCHISGKFFGITWKFFSYLGKNVVYPENFFVMSGKFFWDDPSPPSPTFREKIFRCPFLFEKCP